MIDVAREEDEEGGGGGDRRRYLNTSPRVIPYQTTYDTERAMIENEQETEG